MTLYLLLLSIVFFQSIPSLLNNKYNWNNILAYIFFIELAVILCFKSYVVGADSFGYYNIFLSIQNIPVYTSDTGIEQGYFLFNKLLGCITNNPQIIFIATGLIISYSISNLIYKKSNIVWLSIIIYLTI